jgi:large subunit ribosomal protein L9
MQVILLEDIDNLGKTGDVIKVKDGYARNLLIPKNLAVEATPRSVKQLDHQMRLVEAKRKRDMKTAEDAKNRLENLRITIPAKVGEDEKLYGSITRKNIVTALGNEGIKIEKKKVLLEEPIRSTGVFDVDVKIHQDVTAKLRVWVVAE